MKRQRAILAMSMVLCLLPLQACMAGRELATGPARGRDVEGTYTLLLYGCHYPDDIKDLAILVDQNSAYPVEIYDLDTSYKVKKGVAGPQAFKEAEAFVRCSTRRVSETRVRRIFDGAGGTVGFEVRPLYFPLQFGQADVLQVNYTKTDGSVRAYIRLDPAVERVLESSGSNNSEQGR